MPKKIKENPKATEAKARKEDVKNQKEKAQKKAAADALWVDEGSTASEKRKAEKEQKRIADLAKVQQKKALIAKEEAELGKGKPSKRQENEKMSRSKILSIQERESERKQQEEVIERLKEDNIVPQLELEENINQIRAKQKAADRERYGADGIVDARGIDEAVGVRSTMISDAVAVKVDKHPEKRMKAALAAYEEKTMPLLKAAHPTLKHTQLHDLMFKQWQKATENPLNQQAPEDPEILAFFHARRESRRNRRR